MSKEKILNQYSQSSKLYKDCSIAMKSLISSLLDANSLVPHSISYRVKEKDSLAKKIDKKNKYSSILELTDVIGLRIILNYADEVDLVAEIIESEFDVDKENSIDKRTTLDPDRFGYLSLHYVVKINSNRAELVEYTRFKELKFEIQIRSILQHTWAEIEHDIGYKSKIEVPKSIRRQFSRLAGLLEIADDEFINIRNSLNEYEKNIEETIEESLEGIEVNRISLHEFINSSKIVKKIDSKIAKTIECEIEITEEEEGLAQVLLKHIDFLGIESIFELVELLKSNEKNILSRAKLIEKGRLNTLRPGISILYLVQVLAIKKFDEIEIVDYIKMANYPEGDFMGEEYIPLKPILV